MSDERTISDETICTNCGKPRCEHYDDCGDDYIYCFKDTNGDFFTTEPTPEMEMEAEIERLRGELEKVASCVQQVHPIGEVKHIGHMEAAQAVEDVVKDLTDTVKACLVAAGGSEDNGVLEQQLNEAGAKPSDFIRQQLAEQRKFIADLQFATGCRTVEDGAALKAELARHRAATGHMQQEISVMRDREIASGCVDDYMTQVKIIDGLRQQLEQYKADAERLDWLLSQPHQSWHDIGWALHLGDTIKQHRRAAIDAARGE